MKFTQYIKVTALILAIGGWQQAAAQNQMLSLEDCKKLALEQSRKIKTAQYEIESAKAAAEAAKLNDRPSFNASLMGVHVGKPLDQLLPAAIANASIDIQQPIYAGGKIKLGKEATAKVVEVYTSSKVVTTTEVLLNVETAYWQVVQVKEKITLANKYKEMLQALQRDLKNSYDAGLIYKNDLLRVEVSLNEAELNITKATDGLVMARLNLAQVIGQPGNTAFTIEDSVAGAFDAIAKQPGDSSYASRPEISLLLKAIEAEQIQTKMIKAGLKPTVGVSVSGFGAAGNKINFSNGKDYMFSYYGLISATVPLFDWGKTTKKVKEQDFKIKAKETQLEETKELINLQVQSAYLQLNQSVQKIKLSGLSLQQAEENLRLTNDRYKAGTIVGKDVQEAQAIWQQAYTTLIDAKIEYKINVAGYKKAIGALQ